MTPRSRTASSELEGKILAAALDILGEEGSRGLTVRAIATRAGVAPMGIYNHFDGKTGVIEAVWSEGFDRLADQLRTNLRAGPRDALFECGHQYRRFAHDNEAYYRLMFMEQLDDFIPSAEAAASSGHALQILVDRVEALQATGEFGADRSIDIAQGIWASVHGWVSLELMRVNFATSPDEAYDALLQAIYHGYAK